MTLFEKFKKDHPDAPLNENGFPKICPFHLGYTDKNDTCHSMTCKECWGRKYEGEDEPDVADKIIATYDKLCERFDNGWSNSIIRGLIDGGYFKDGN